MNATEQETARRLAVAIVTRHGQACPEWVARLAYVLPARSARLARWIDQYGTSR